MKKLLMLSCLLVIGLSNIAAQDIFEITDSIFKPNLGILDPKANDIGELDKILNNINTMKAMEIDNGRLDATIQFAAGGDQNGNEDENLYKLEGGVSVSRGSFPTQLNLRTSFSTILNGGEFQENLSTIHFSYDIHPVKNKLWLESYGFFERFTDKFLDIDQRYEVGGGVIFNWWLKGKAHPDGGFKGYTAEGRNLYAVLHNYEFTDALASSAVFKAYCNKANVMLPSDFAAALASNQVRNDKRIRKQYSKFRLALLVGVFAEAESGSTIDSLFGSDSLLYSESKNFNATFLPRWQIRPTISIKPSDDLRIYTHLYWKLPFPGEQWFSDVEGPYVHRRVDFRLDFITKLEYRFKEKIKSNGNKVTYGMTLSHRYLYDNAPRRDFVTVNNDLGFLQLLESDFKHHIFQLSFDVKFN